MDTGVSSLPISDNPIAMQALGVSPEVLEKHYHELLAKKPNDVKTLVNLADLLSYEQRYLEAVDYYRKALESDSRRTPTYAPTWGSRCCGLDRYQEAIEAFRQAVVVAPDDAVIHYNLGVAFAVPRLGDPKTAIVELQRRSRSRIRAREASAVGDAQTLIEELQTRIEAQRGHLGSARRHVSRASLGDATGARPPTSSR